MWDDQKRFNSNFVEFPKLDEKQKVVHSKEYILHLYSELDEFLRELNWKIHRKGKGEVILSNLKEEWIDAFKYWLSLGILWGFSPEEFLEEYWRKSAVVEQRHKQEIKWDLSEEKIAGVDIDGVLADYPGHFLHFLNKELGTNHQLEGIRDYDIGASLQLPRDLYEDIKDKFRQTGQKRYMGILPGAKDFLEGLKADGYGIVLLTARPYKKYKRIFADTQEWLKAKELVYDCILWDEDKCARLVREFGSGQVKFFVEDHIGNANKMSQLGMKVFLVDKPYNQGELGKGVVRVQCLDEIREILKGLEV